jgi:hypothetical protein
LKGPKLPLALFIAVVSVAYGVPTHKKPVTAPPPPPVQDDRGTDKSPIAVKGNVTATLPPPTAEQIQAENAKAADDHNLAVATDYLAGLTAVLALIAVVQLYLFLRQLKLSEKAARDAETAANAAKASADALPKIERAYVFIEVSISDFIQNMHEIGHFDITVRLTNHGKTPALLTLVRSYVVWSESPPEALVEHEKADRPLPPGLVVGAERTFELTSQHGVDGEVNRQLHDIASRMYFVGVVEYEDIMRVKHRTGFCWHTYPIGGLIKVSITPSPLNFFD